MASSSAVLTRPGALSIDGVPLPLVAGLLAIAAVGSVVVPLATYALTLAVFGMPHVVQEMRWVKHRFGDWAGPWLVLPGLCLAGICLTRLATLFLGLPGEVMRLVELGLVVGLVITTFPLWARGGWVSRLLGAGTVALLGLGLALAPILTLLIVAVVHNWTPVPFVLEATSARDRLHVGLASVVVLGLLPVLIATGLPWMAIDALGLGAPEWTLLATGSLTSNFGAYLPSEIWLWPHAQHLFSAIVFAQCTHYIVILTVLPTLRGGPVGRLRTGLWTFAALFAGSAIITALFVLDFRFGRAFYGAFSAVHAWVELPLFLLVLTSRRLPASSPTTASSGSA